MRRPHTLRLVLGICLGAIFFGFVPPASATGSPVVAHGSVGQVFVTDATPGAVLELRNESGELVERRTVNRLGAALFRGVTPGDGYRVNDRRTRGNPSPPVRVLRDDETPPQSFYTEQSIGPGYGYLATRDGTTLAVDVHLPGPAEDGPYPTVVEYSGYPVANPDDAQIATQLAQALGYATVGVNLRGTGCSGGAWSYFEPFQGLDGYDVIETIAAQPWVLHNKVGMIGISYSGITQLFVAADRPPHLAAITPLSVIDDTYRGVLYPGGILNVGFAVPWAEDRQSDAGAAPRGGQGWAGKRVKAGDETCGANQALHLEAENVHREIRRSRYFSEERLGPVTPSLFVDRIQAPVFIAGAWQDEQTGGRWPDLLPRFSEDTVVRAVLTNGTHVEPLFPSIITRWAEFLDFYVAQRVPRIPATTRQLAPLLYAEATGELLELPPDRFEDAPSYLAARSRYEAEPPVRILFDNGAGGAPGVPAPGFEVEFPTWPPPGTTPTTWFLGPDGTLTTDPPAGGGIDRYRYEPTDPPTTTEPLSDSDLLAAVPEHDWRPLRKGRSLAYVGPPLAQDTVIAGPGSIDVWLRSDARDIDLEVTLSEVRPDGRETYVQSGWLRTSHRALDERASTTLEPVHLHTRAAVQPLPQGSFALVRVAIFPFAHAFRAGSRIQISLQSPTATRPLWAFDALPARGKVINQIAYSPQRASVVVLPVVEDLAVPTSMPPCPALRGQPCRESATIPSPR